MNIHLSWRQAIWIIYSCHLFQPALPLVQGPSLQHQGLTVNPNGGADEGLLLELCLVPQLRREDQLTQSSSSFHFSELVNGSSSEGVPNDGCSSPRAIRQCHRQLRAWAGKRGAKIVAR